MNYIQLPSIYTKWRLLCLLSLNIFQHAGKLFMNSLLLMVWELYFSVFSEMILWTKKHVTSSITTTQCFSSLIKS